MRPRPNQKYLLHWALRPRTRSVAYVVRWRLPQWKGATGKHCWCTTRKAHDLEPGRQNSKQRMVWSSFRSRFRFRSFPLSAFPLPFCVSTVGLAEIQNRDVKHKFVLVWSGLFEALIRPSRLGTPWPTAVTIRHPQKVISPSVELLTIVL